ncbi:MAG: mechanosensitive ion channel domain-containing protein [Gammaproteobacteria bacterium]
MTDPNLVTALARIAFILVASLALLRFLVGGVTRTADRYGLSPNAAYVIGASVRWIVIVLAAVLVAQAAGISMHAVWTAVSAVAVMVAIGFVAMWSVVSNLLCAVLLVIFAPFRIGDEIEILDVANVDPEKHGLKGRVIAINMLYTVLAQDAGSTLRVPNNLLFQRAIRTVEGEETASLGSSLFHHD